MKIAVVNQKGGVGKTTAVVNLAAACADKGSNVLVVDLDPQANATAAIAPDLDPTSTLTAYDVLESGAEGCAEDAIRPTDWSPRLHLLPSELGLAKRERDNSIAVEQRLRHALKGVSDRYDLVLIDCPPNVGVLTVNAMVAADRALLISEPARASLQGIQAVLDTVSLVAENYNAALRVAGIIVNRYEPTREAQFRVQELTAAFGDQLWHPVIPKRAAVVEAYGLCLPVNRLPSQGARDAWDAVTELADRMLALIPEKV